MRVRGGILVCVETLGGRCEVCDVMMCWETVGLCGGGSKFCCWVVRDF